MVRERLEHWWYAVPLRLRSIFRRNQVEEELEEEFRFHLDQLITQEMAAGKTPEEARHAALRAMAGIERQKENCRDMRRVPYLENFLHEFRQACRALLRKPRFTAGVIAILALGVGASTAAFSVVDAVLLRPLPYTAADRLVKIEENTAKREMKAVMLGDFFALARRTDLFDKAVAYVRDNVTVTGAGEPSQAIVSRASGGLFSMLGARAHLGRALVETDDDLSNPNVAVLSDRFWRQVYRGNPDVVGRVIQLSDEPYTVIGVMPREFEFQYSNIDLWVPIRLTPAFNGPWLGVTARLKEGISIAQARSALEIAAHQFEREDPEEKASLRIAVSPWRETPTREYELTLVFIFGAVGLVLMIACVNVASLLLSRAVQRQKEMAIRASLGAGLWQVVRQLLAESFVLAVAGSAAGIVLARYALEYLIKQLARLPIPLPHLQRIALDERVLLFNIILCLALACTIGAAPILMASKTDLQAVLRSGQGAGNVRTSTRLFSILIAWESAFAFLLLVGSGLMIRSLVRLEEADHGLQPDHVLTMRVPVNSLRQMRHSGKYDTKPQQMAYYRELVDRLHRVPGVKALAVVNNLPLWGCQHVSDGQRPGTHDQSRILHRHGDPADRRPLFLGQRIGPDRRAWSSSISVWRKSCFQNRNAVGEKLPNGESESRDGPTIVGVVHNAPQQSYEKPSEGEIYLPYQQFIFGAFMSTIVVRTSGDPLALADSLKKQYGRLTQLSPS